MFSGRQDGIFRRTPNNNERVHQSTHTQWKPQNSHIANPDLIILVTFNGDLCNAMQIPSLSPSDTKAPPHVQLQLTARLGNAAQRI